MKSISLNQRRMKADWRLIAMAGWRLAAIRHLAGVAIQWHQWP